MFLTLALMAVFPWPNYNCLGCLTFILYGNCIVQLAIATYKGIYYFFFAYNL